MIAALIASPSEAPLSKVPLANFPTGSVTVLDRDFRYVVAKGQILPSLGLAPEMLVGRRIHDVFPSHVVESSEPLYARAFAGEEVTLDLPWNGRLLEIRATPSEHDELGVSTVLVVAEDVTSARRAAARLRFQVEASAILGMSLDIDTALSAIADLTVTHLADFCAIYVVNDEGRIQRVAFGHSDPSHASLARELAEGFELRQGVPHGPLRVIESGSAELIHEVRDDMLVAIARDERHLALLRRMNLAASLIVPLLAHGRVVGALTLLVSHPQPPFSQEDCALAEDLAQRIAFAVENARMYRLVQQERDQLKHADKAERPGVAALGRLATSNAIGIATIEGESIIDANDAFLRIVGYDATDLHAGGLSWWTITPPAYRSLVVQGLAELLSTGVSTPYEKEYVRKDGSRVPILYGAALLEREPLRWVSFAIDLSSRHELEQAHLAFIKELGTDLTNPITVTRWASHLMGRQGWTGEPGTENLGHTAGNHRKDGRGVIPAWPVSGSEAGRERVRRFGRGKRRRLPSLD
jgi:PAS domain S-box-containing protein